MQNRKITATKVWKRMRDSGVTVFTLLAVALCCILSGCSSKWKDGTYLARFRYPEDGYLDYLSVTIQKGKVTQVELDGYAEENTDRKRSEAQPDSDRAKWKSGLEKSIRAAGMDADKIKSVAGAEAYTAKVKQLYQAILTQAAKGNTGEIIVENAQSNSVVADKKEESGQQAESSDTDGSRADDVETDNNVIADNGGSNTTADSDNTSGDVATDGDNTTDGNSTGGSGTTSGTDIGKNSGSTQSGTDSGTGAAQSQSEAASKK